VCERVCSHVVLRVLLVPCILLLNNRAGLGPSVSPMACWVLCTHTHTHTHNDCGFSKRFPTHYCLSHNIRSFCACLSDCVTSLIRMLKCHHRTAQEVSRLMPSRLAKNNTIQITQLFLPLPIVFTQDVCVCQTDRSPFGSFNTISFKHSHTHLELRFPSLFVHQNQNVLSFQIILYLFHMLVKYAA